MEELVDVWRKIVRGAFIAVQKFWFFNQFFKQFCVANPPKIFLYSVRWNSWKLIKSGKRNLRKSSEKLESHSQDRKRWNDVKERKPKISQEIINNLSANIVKLKRVPSYALWEQKRDLLPAENNWIQVIRDVQNEQS